MTEANLGYFHFSLGPVQDFVSQARRTRDFWAGSFLLSFLSAVAMKEVIEQTGDDKSILFPAADDDRFLKWLGKQASVSQPGPEQGSIPNRFKAEIDMERFKPEDVVEAVNQAWAAIADKVWDNDLDGLKKVRDSNGRISAIWDRQVHGFWEVFWTITVDKDDSAVLDQRKNWRSHRLPDEAGVKCMMMDGLQELSGEQRPLAEPLANFWESVRKNGREGIKTDLRLNEHLCAVGFVKRRFSRYFHLVETEMPAGWELDLTKWKLDHGRPSVTYMAAVHWLEEVIRKANVDDKVSEALWEYYDAGFALTGGQPERGNNIRCINDVLDLTKGQKKWASLDGSVFFESALQNKNIFPCISKAEEVLSKLRQLRKLADVAPPSPFYSVLMMDGDSLGVHMGDPAKQSKITEGLKRFTEEVGEIVKRRDGFLIYAGGDDVLAILPLEDALTCAHELRRHYMCCFKGSDIPTSLSGAVNFAHINTPLGRVLADSHDLLDNVAKDATGRDAIAVRVLKPGGVALQWAMPRDSALEGEGCDEELVVSRLARQFVEDDENGNISNGLLYKIRSLLDLLNPSEDEIVNTKIKGQTENADVDEFDPSVELLATEYLSSGMCENKKKQTGDKDLMAYARRVVGPLLDQCHIMKRINGKSEKQGMIRADGAMLIRFLAHKGIE